MVCRCLKLIRLEPFCDYIPEFKWAADAGYEDFIARINEPLTFLSLKIRRAKYNVRLCVRLWFLCLLGSKPGNLQLTIASVLQLDDEWYIAFVNEVCQCALNSCYKSMPPSCLTAYTGNHLSSVCGLLPGIPPLSAGGPCLLSCVSTALHKQVLV